MMGHLYHAKKSKGSDGGFWPERQLLALSCVHERAKALATAMMGPLHHAKYEVRRLMILITLLRQGCASLAPHGVSGLQVISIS